MRKNIIIAALAASSALLLAASCSKQEQPQTSVSEAKTFTASIDQELTKTTITSDFTVNWENTDQININGVVYNATPKTDATKADFVKNDEGDTDPSSPYKAIYPASLYVTDHFEFPATQAYAEGQFNAPMYAESSTESLNFKNICGVLCFALKGTDKVRRIYVTANENVCGTFTVTAEGATTLTGSGNTVALDCSEGVQLEAETATNFYVYLPAGTYTAGMKIVIVTTDSKTFTKTTTGDVTITNNNLYTFHWTPTFAHEVVQLWEGGPYWATMNVGACSPEDYGDYYAWGETTTKSDYSWSTYLDSPNRDGNSFTKYFNGEGGKTVLNAEDDVAHVKWGGKWRMPTDGEWNELWTNCTWAWTNDYKGTVAGWIVTSNTNDNSIFLPAAGGRDGTTLGSAGSYGYYWSSSLDSDNSDSASYVYFLSVYVFGYSSCRYYGLSVRPVSE